jgi:hypothetical protein
MTEQDSGPDGVPVVERFQPTNGRFSGFLGLGAAGVILVLALVDGDAGRPLGIAILAVLGGLLVWAALLRPAMWATSRDLVMRGMFHTDAIPLAAIDRVVVTQVLTVSAGGKRYTSPAVGYTARQTMKAKSRSRGATEKTPSEVDTHQLFVEARINHLAQDTRDRTGIKKGSPEQAALAADVRRTYAWPEIVGVAVCTLAFLTWLAL